MLNSVLTDKEINEKLAKTMGWTVDNRPHGWTDWKLPDGSMAFWDRDKNHAFTQSYDVFYTYVMPVLKERGLGGKWVCKVLDAVSPDDFDEPFRHDDPELGFYPETVFDFAQASARTLTLAALEVMI